MSILRAFHIGDLTLGNQGKAPCHLTWMVSRPNQSGATSWSLSLGSETAHFDRCTLSVILCPFLCPFLSAEPRNSDSPSCLSPKAQHQKGTSTYQRERQKTDCVQELCLRLCFVTRNSCSEMPLFIEINFNVYNQLYGPVWKPPLDLITVSAATVEGEGFLVSLLIPSHQNFLISFPVMQQKQKENGLSERVCFSSSSSWFLKVFPKSCRSCLSAWPSGTQLSGWICSKGLSWQKVLK